MPRKKSTIDIRPLCDRVVVNSDGFAVSARDAFNHHGICAKVIFLRADGWSLGAPAELERVALATWADHWVSFMRWPLYERQPIKDYRIPAEKK